jgi:saccharopine dehydrogenase-like NADP-dependent oxidoreductase
MKVLALGGCGEMGRYAVNTLIQSNNCSNVIIADINEENAKNAAAEYGRKVSWLKIDVTDRRQLEKAMCGVDVVMNTVGPFYRFGVHVLRAAIKARCHYFDICDDWEPTLAMLELDASAKKAGVTAVVGLGATPGVGNLLAVKAMNALERVKDVHIGWNIECAVSEPPENGRPLGKLSAPDYKPNSAKVHGVHQITGKIRVRKCGRYVDEKPLKAVKIDYPALGCGTAWSIGHPEPLTMPRYFPEIKNSLNLFAAPRKLVRQLRFVCFLVNLKIVSVHRAAIMFEKDEIKHRRWENEALDWRYKVPRGEIPLPVLFAVAYGEREGKPAAAAATIRSVPPGKMGGATGIPLAVGILMLANNNIDRKGVFAPEGGIDPDLFFDEMALFCEPSKSNADDLILVTRSWENTNPDLFP